MKPNFQTTAFGLGACANVRLGNFRYTVPGDQKEMETTYSKRSVAQAFSITSQLTSLNFADIAEWLVLGLHINKAH